MIDWQETVAFVQGAVGSRYYHDLCLMNGATVRVEGTVRVNAVGVTALVYVIGRREYRDANWYTPRRHYPWVKVNVD